MKKNHDILISLAVFAVTVAAFVRCWDYGIVNLDDYCYLTVKPLICHWSGWETIRFAFTDMSESIWMPLTWLSYAFDSAVFGRWYGGFHLHSIVIHAINALLVWRLLLLLFSHKGDGSGVRFACLAGALIWAVHPLRCESVVFVASRKDVLSFMWEALAILFWIRGSRSDGHVKIAWFTLLSFVFFVVGFMCKPSVMTFPVLCLIVDLLIERKVYFLRYPLFLATMLFFGWFAAQQQGVSATQDFAVEPLYDRALDAAAAFGIYVRNQLCPLWLAPQCIKRWPAPPRFLLPGLVISAVWGYYLLQRTMDHWQNRLVRYECKRFDDMPVVLTGTTPPDYLFAGMLWFAVAIGPMLGIANFGYHAFADRFTYIPAVGLSILVVLAIRRLTAHAGNFVTFGSASLMLVLCIGLSWHQTGYWRDDFALFSHTLEVDGDDNAAAHGVLANWYFEFPHDVKKSAEHFETSVRADISNVLGSYEIFILALGESGQAEKIPEFMKRYEQEIERRYGQDMTRRILQGDLELQAKSGMVRTLYRACKLAWWLTDEKTYPRAQEILESVENQPQLKSDALWTYMRWKYYSQTGDETTAKELYAKLMSEDEKPGYSQFRFLRARGR